MQTTVTTEQEARAPAGSATRPAARVGWSSPRGWLQQQLPRLVLSPTVLITFVFVYGFILWTVYLSFTRSRGIPSHELVGGLNYERVWNHPLDAAVLSAFVYPEIGQRLRKDRTLRFAPTQVADRTRYIRLLLRPEELEEEDDCFGWLPLNATYREQRAKVRDEFARHHGSHTPLP